MITSENDFSFIRHQLLNKPTIPEYQIASQIAKTIDVHSKEQAYHSTYQSIFLPSTT